LIAKDHDCFDGVSIDCHAEASGGIERASGLRQRITDMSRNEPEEPEITEAILDTLAYAA